MKIITPARYGDSPFRDPRPAFGLVPLKEGTVQSPLRS